MTTWLNSKRLRDYPRLFLVASWLIILLNFILHRGWIGGLTGILIGGDFISNYSGGMLYSTDISRLYDPIAQQEVQVALIAPSQSPGFAPFISPPHVAMAMSWLDPISLQSAFIGWQVLNLICVFISAYLIYRYILPRQFTNNQIDTTQLSIIILSTFAFVVGFTAGQSHGITLLLTTGMIVAMLKEKWIIAGLLGSLLTYKPQFVLGFLICWLLWRRIGAVLGFGIFTAIWQIPVLLSNGIKPYFGYLAFTRTLMYLPYAKESFPISIMATPYALFSTLLPVNWSKGVQILYVFGGIILVTLLCYIIITARSGSKNLRTWVYVSILLFPLIIAPHTLLYDLIILVPAIILLSGIDDHRQNLLKFSVICYVGVLILPLIGYSLKIALTASIPIAFLIYLIRTYFRSNIIAVES
jgi:hypothetical protein